MFLSRVYLVLILFSLLAHVRSEEEEVVVEEEPPPSDDSNAKVDEGSNFVRTVEGLVACIVNSNVDIDERIGPMMRDYGCYCRYDQTKYEQYEPKDDIDRVCKTYHTCMKNLFGKGMSCGGKSYTLKDIPMRMYDPKHPADSVNGCMHDSPAYCNDEGLYNDGQQDDCAKEVCSYCDYQKIRDLTLAINNDITLYKSTFNEADGSSWYQYVMDKGVECPMIPKQITNE